jgi:threonine dehydratase
MTDVLTTTDTDTAADWPALTAADVAGARARIDGAVVRTPTLHSKTLSQITGAEIWLKFENLQFTAAYKERGALNALLQMDEERRARGVIAASAGNHAQGLAYHGARLGVPVTIVMPSTTPTVKVQQTQSHGATIVLHGEKYDDAYAHARELEAQRGLTFVHPFDHPHIAAGQGTVALEMLADVPELDTLVIPIGGGGLFTGMGTAARGINPAMRLVGVQAELYPSMYAAIHNVAMVSDGDTLAEGIAVREPGEYTRRMVAKLADDILLVGERHLERAVSLLLQIEKTVVPDARLALCCAAAISTRGCWRTCCCAIWRAPGGWRGCGCGCRTGPARCST